MRSRRCAVASVLLCATPVCWLRAQDTRTDASRQPPTSAKGQLPITGCSGQPISEIVVLANAPYTDRLPRAFDFLRGAARSLHTTTRQNVIRNYLLLHVGEPCNQIRRAESERILRAQSFLVDARIRVYDDERGGVRLEVETRDEFSASVATAITGRSPFVRAMKIGESNLFGTARQLVLQWRDGLAYRDGWGAQYTDYQFLGGRNELRLLGLQRERGEELRMDLVHPFYTDLQRYALNGSVGNLHEYFEFRRPGFDRNAVQISRQGAVVGGLARIGSTGRLKLVGFSFTQAHENYDATPVRITKSGFQTDSGPPLDAHFYQRRSVRANALFGMRMLQFVPVQGFDALSGTQDVRVGFQMSSAFGHSLLIGDSRDHDRFMGGSAYGGVGNAKLFVGAQLSGEGRNDRGAKAWENQIYAGRIAAYFRPAVRQLSTLSLEWSAGRNMHSPFQLSFADRDGGLRGHVLSTTPGGTRAIVRAEQRLVIPSRFDVADIGVALFAEAGRLWSEPTVLYSQNSPTSGAVGISLLAAVPPKSRRMWRVDFAMPVGTDPNKHFEIRLSNADRTRTFWREPNDVIFARERTTPPSLFNWP